MAAVSQDSENAGDLRAFVAALHCNLQNSEETFPFPAVKEQCLVVLNTLASKIESNPESGDQDIAKAGEDLLVLVSQTDCAELSKRLLSYGVNPDCAIDNFEMFSGVTPLSMAAIKGHLGVCRVLVEGGASVEQPSHCSSEQGSADGITPLIVAARTGRHEITR